MHELKIPSLKAGGDVTGRAALSPDNSDTPKLLELTANQRAVHLKTEPHRLTQTITLTPVHARSGQSYVDFKAPLWVSTNPVSYSPATGFATFKANPDIEFNPSVEISFIPINPHNPHLVEINIGLLDLAKGPVNYQFEVKMLTDQNPEMLIDFAENDGNPVKPIVFVFPAVTGTQADQPRVIKFTEKNDNEAVLWAFYSVRITSFK